MPMLNYLFMGTRRLMHHLQGRCGRAMQCNDQKALWCIIMLRKKRKIKQYMYWPTVGNL